MLVTENTQVQVSSVVKTVIENQRLRRVRSQIICTPIVSKQVHFCFVYTHPLLSHFICNLHCEKSYIFQPSRSHQTTLKSLEEDCLYDVVERIMVLCRYLPHAQKLITLVVLILFGQEHSNGS